MGRKNGERFNLTKALGPLGMVRFIQQFETGVGDYTKERDLWLKEMDIKTIISEIKVKRKKGKK
jgi:hypothetical protein